MKNNRLPTLSKSSRDFVNDYNGQEIPLEIRAELEKYIIDLTPFLKAGFQDMKNRFDKILKE